jgi:uncharacterized membrane protein YjjP (DUF1212 family)
MEWNMETKERIEVAIIAGEILLRSGAEVYRVEETINRICKSGNIECECFVLPFGIFVSSSGNNQDSITRLRRIENRTVDLHRIESVNAFSRNLEKNLMSYDEAKEQLAEINATKRFSYPLRIGTAGVIALVFTLLFKGNIMEASTAFFLSMVIYIINEELAKIGLIKFLEYFVSGIVAASGSLLAMKLFPGMNLYKIIVGAIMILVPGVYITNGIIDALHGDTNSSMLRMIESLLIAVAVGAGVTITLSVGLRLL